MRNPYVTGPYVTGRRHYGRQELLDRLLHSAQHAYWVIGNRRIGKTSLLRQLETVALSGAQQLPIFWDMQGCRSFADLGDYLADAIQERIDELLALGLPESMAREHNALILLPALRRAVAHAGRELLLLCDETEVLLQIAQEEPEQTQRLHRELTRGAGLRVVAISTRAIYQMHDVCREWPTSSFLSGFDMTQMLGSLDRESARSLVLQTQADDLVQAAPEVVDAICEYANDHPYLLQTLCFRVFQSVGSLRPVIEDDLAVDPLLAGFFRNDIGLLVEDEQRLIWAIYDRGEVDDAALTEILGEDRADLRRSVRDLETLGYLRRREGRLRIGNDFLQNWLRIERPQSPQPALPFHKNAAPPAPGDPTADRLKAQLNAKRSRLMELEVIRARELLEVSSEILAEIRQTEDDIRRLLTDLAVRSA